MSRLLHISLVVLLSAGLLLVVPGTTATAAPGKSLRVKAISDRTVDVGDRVRVRIKTKGMARRQVRFSARGRPGWLKIKKRKGVLVGRAPARTAGKTYRITVRARVPGRGKKGRDKRRFKLNVVKQNQPAPNRPPRIGPLADAQLVEDTPLTDPLRIAVSDPDRDRVTVDLFGLPPGLAFDAASRTVSGTPTHPGVYPVAIIATDGRRYARADARFTVDPVNDAPVIDDQEMTIQAGTPDGQTIGSLVAADEEEEPLIFEGSDDERVLVKPDGSVQVKDAEAVRSSDSPFTLQVTVTDGDQESSATLSVTVARAPDRAPVVEDQAREVEELAAAGSPVGEPLEASDADGDSISWELEDDADGAFAVDPSTGQLSVTASPDFEATPSYELSVRVTAGTLSDTASVTVDVLDVNEPPQIAPVDDAAGKVGESISPITIEATDPDGDDVTLNVTGLPQGLAHEAGTISGTPTERGSFLVTVTADDGEGGNATATFEITVAPADPAPACAPISTLPCDGVPVEVPSSVTFDGTEGGLADTGFTMVQPPSARDGTDQAPAPGDPTHADVPGFEPGLVRVAGGNLELDVTKGIAYRNPAGSSATNSQLNTLGVGLAGGTDGYELSTTVVDPTFTGGGNGSQQGGLWFGLGEDDFVKLVVGKVNDTQNKVQLVREIGAVAQPGTEYELNTAPFAAEQDVRLVLEVDGSGTGTVVRASYAVGDGALQPLVDSANTVSDTELPVPDTFLLGVALPSGGDDATFGGVFGTKRNAPASTDLTISFADFSVAPLEDVVDPFTPVDVMVDFTAEDGDPAPGALKDFGQPFGPRTGPNQGGGDHAYGWVKENSEEELSLVGNGRVRGRPGVDPELDSIIHMQYDDVPAGKNCTANVCEDGDWQFDVANGVYDVTVAVGDEEGGSGYDSLHVVNVENQVLLEEFTGTGTEEYATATTRVGVADGELTLNATGGSNTKPAWVSIASASDTTADSQPFVVQSRPANRSLGAALGEGIAADVHLIGTTADPGPVDAATVTDETVRLFEVVLGGADAPVSGNPQTTGGGDSINFQQSGDLKPTTTYRYVVDGVRDELGNEFVPFTSVFTTGTGDDDPGGGTFDPVEGVSFDKVDTGKDGRYFASLVVHEGFLWATTVGQGMYRYPINDDGTLGDEQDIAAFDGRAAIGLVFDRQNPGVAWVTHATANIGNESQAFGSKVSRVDFSADPLSPQVDDVFLNLPRSKKDHLSNSLSYGPGGDLYFLQGSNQAAGDADGAWGDRGESLLTAALLTFDPESVWQQVQADGPIDVRTVDKGGSYDPFTPDAPLKLYATGIRNAYDLVHTVDGDIFVPTNGTASGGNSPGVTANGGTLTRTGQVSGQDVTDVCATRRIDGSPYTGPTVPAITNHNTQRDFLFNVEQGGYYGHPNPARCEWVLNNASNPEGAGSGGSNYPASVQPDRNYRGWAYDFEFNKSPNGVIEYRSNTFGGKLRGRLMVVRFSNFDDVLTLEKASNGTIEGAQPGSTIGGFSGFDDPLDIVEDTDTGNLYVNSYDQSSGQPRLYLLRVPDGEEGADLEVSTSRLVGNQPTGAGPRSLGTVTLENAGSQPATVEQVTIDGAGAAAYSQEASQTLPATLEPGDTMTVTVRFDPTSEGVAPARLGFTLAEGTAPDVALRGLGTDGSGGNDEPSLQYVFDTWQLGIDTGDDDDTTTPIHSDPGQRVAPELGDALDVETFERHSDGPVTVEPISLFGPTSSDPVTEVSWYDVASPTERSSVFSAGNQPAGNGQSLTPATTGPMEFDPGTSTFGFVSRWPAFADRLVHSQDALNTFSGAIGNHVRVYPLVEGGRTIPHAYVVATEEHTSGFDYNDVVYVVRNVDPAGNEPEPPGETIKVNFQSEPAPVPDGYLKDFGQAYGARSGADQGEGLSFGWVDPSGSPDGRTTTGRDRGNTSDQRLDTLMHLQYQQQASPNCTANNCTTGHWEMAVPDGTYRVLVSVGDGNNNQDPESHQIRAEGVPMLDEPLVPTGAAGSAGHFASGTQLVEVDDGRLTLDPVGGLNTKVNYVEVTPVGSGGGETVAQVNFQPAGVSTPAGWSADSGALFDAGRGYGWVRTEGGAAKADDTRDRGGSGPLLDRTLVIVDDAVVPAVVDGEWEHAVADGTYTVTVSVGDPDYADSTHGVAVEGEPVVNGFTPGAPGDNRVASAEVEVTDGRLTVASTGTNTKLQWISIASGSDVDVIPPTVRLDVTGVSGDGGYVQQATVTADVGDRGGSGIEFVDWTVDGAEVSRPAGDQLVVDQPGSHTVEVTATDAAGNATTESVTFTIVDGAVAAIDVRNLHAPRSGGEPMPGLSDDLVTMSLINSGTSTHRTHTTGSIEITNTDADEDLVVTGLDVSAARAPLAGIRSNPASFSVPDVELPLTVAPGESTVVPVLFSGPGSKGLYGATLTVVSNAANAPEHDVQLRGAWMAVPEGGNELTATQLTRAFGWSTDLGEPLQEENDSPLAGDEVRSRLWKRLDPGQPMRVLQVAAFHGCCGSEDSFSISGGPAISHDGAWGQSILPRVATSGDAPASAALTTRTYSPGGDFAIQIQGYTTDEDDNLGVRLFPVSVGGETVPGAYIVLQDFVQNGCGSGSANCDYQDNIYLVTNVAPVTP